MNKKLFTLLIILMSLSLAGIIFVQWYWINNSVQSNKEQFTFNVKQVLLETSREIQQNEVNRYYARYQKVSDSIGRGLFHKANYSEFLYSRKDNQINEVFIYSNGIIEADYKLSSSFLDHNLSDTIKVKRLFNQKILQRFTSGMDGIPFNKESKVIDFKNMAEYEKDSFEESIRDISSKIPIHERISKKEIKYIISKELREREIKSTFEYGIYSNGLATKVHSQDFVKESVSTYVVPLFVDDISNNNYRLFVNFPEKNIYVLSNIKGMAALSLIFTSIIILAYANALSQLFKQKQISQIKTDFINNMTHEFKTPIATINLALDAIKNPKIINDAEKVSRYLNIIREENKRMHAQVENVLRISKLEKNQLNLEKEYVNFHDIIEDAISHVALIVEDSGGYINTQFNASNTSILANDSHFVNVIVNILDNAVKYSTEQPKIEIITENVNGNIILNITDKGSGISKSAQKQIFEKFYREHTGNIHNVKGHGLGLAYVKRVVDDHQGQIFVESEKGKGSTFTIKLKLIS